MKLTLLIFGFITFESFGQNSDSLFYNEFLQGVKEKSVRQRIIFIKNKTDKYLFTPFSTTVRQNFFFAFPGCTFRTGFSESNGRVVYFTSMRGQDDTTVVDVINNYQFDDKSVRLHVQDINVYYNDETNVELHFYSRKDSLIVEALKNIYNKGYLHKIKKKIRDAKLKNYYTILDIDEKKGTVNIIVKDKQLPHSFFIN